MGILKKSVFAFLLYLDSDSWLEAGKAGEREGGWYTAKGPGWKT